MTPDVDTLVTSIRSASWEAPAAWRQPMSTSQPDPAKQRPAENYSAANAVAFGYMRVPCTVPDRKVRRMELALRTLAARFGLPMQEIFTEFDCGAREAYSDLLQALNAVPSRTVVVPTLQHLALNPLLHHQMLRELEGVDSRPESGLGVLILAEFTRGRRISPHLKQATLSWVPWAGHRGMLARVAASAGASVRRRAGKPGRPRPHATADLAAPRWSRL